MAYLIFVLEYGPISLFKYIIKNPDRILLLPINQISYGMNKYLTAIDGFSLKSLPQPLVQSSKYNAKLMVKDEGQDPRSPSEFVSLEDKQVLTEISHQKHPLSLFYPRVGRRRL